MNELITVVVPVYNIENYIGKCIESILNQTYKKLEILIINDGSTDNSKTICEKYKDDRLQIITKKNGGLSDARNFGLKKAKGKYILFIDGDDFIEPNMIEVLYENLIKTDSDISACSFKYYYEDGSVLDYYSHNDENSIVEMNQEEALKNIVNNNIAFKQCAWNKLYKIELFTDIEYPFGKIYEDMGTTYKLILKSKKIVYTHKNLYYYVQRGNSITKTFNFNEKELHRIEMANDFVDNTIDVYPTLKKDLMKFKIMQYIAVSNVMIRCNKIDNILIKETKKMIKENLSICLKKSNFKEKIQIVLYLINFNLYKKVFLRKVN